MEQMINNMTNNILLESLVIVIALDTLLGSLRAIKERKWNSTFGINGLLRKIAMLCSTALLIIIDYIINVDFIGFVPDDLIKYIGGVKVGISTLFAIIFVLYEFTSVLKNMLLCGLPVPKKLKDKIEEILKKYTTELQDK